MSDTPSKTDAANPDAELKRFMASTRKTLRLHTQLLIAVLALLLFWTVVSVWMTYQANTASPPQQPVPPVNREGSSGDPGRYSDFPRWPVSKKMAEASVVLVTRYEPSGVGSKQTIAEILKQAPDVRFPYRVGDPPLEKWTFYEAPRPQDPDAPYLGGVIVFLVGPDLRVGFGTSYQVSADGSERRISPLEGLTLSQLREIAKK